MSSICKSSLANHFDDEFSIIRHTSETSGLNSYQLLKLCSWLESKEIGENSKLELIECLIPKENGGTIPEEVCIRLTCLLNSHGISLIMKVEILKYMISAYSFMETNGRFQMLYENFLGFLKNTEIRSYAAHFIYLFTQKKHVTYRRVQYIYKLIGEYSQLPCFMLILHAYFLHCPEYFDSDIQDLLYNFEDLGTYPSLIRNVHHAYEPNFSEISFQESNIFETFTKSRVSVSGEKSDILSHKCTPFKELYKRFRALQKSVDISKILESDMKRIFLTTRLKREVQIRVHDYILSVLHRDSDSEDFIKKHLDIIRLQHSISGMSEFNELLLSKKLSNPDIAEVICYEPICCFKKISHKLRVILEKILATDDVTVKCQWLDAASKLFCYWILQGRKLIPCSENCDKDHNSDDDDSSVISVVHISNLEIRKLNSSVDFLFDCLLLKDCCPFIINRILSHYEMAFYACKLKKNYVPSFPSVFVFQLSLLSLTPLILDVLGRVMLRINKIHNLIASDLNDEEYLFFQASCNDIKKLFLDSSYERDNTYLAKAKVFKKLKEICPEFEDFFKLHKHPALLLKTIEFDEKSDSFSSEADFVLDSNNRLDFFFYHASHGIPNFMMLIKSIK